MSPDEPNAHERIMIHEAICAQRYEQILERFREMSRRMTRMETIIWSTTIGIIIMLLAITAFLLQKAIIWVPVSPQM